MTPSPISVPENVLLGIDAVRKSGLTNMLMRPVVIELARELGFPESAKWIENNRKLYAEGVFKGFVTLDGK